LHFLPDQYLGSLHVEDPCLGSEYMEHGRDLSLPYGLDPRRVVLGGDFDFAGLAQGDVAVPAGRNVKLIVMLRLPSDRRELASLPPGGYKMFGTDRCREDPEDLSGLSSLDPNDLWKIRVSRLVPTARADEQVLEPISRLTGLQILELSGTGITDRGLEHLRSLRSLGALQLEREPFIGNQGLAVLKDLPSLEYLDLYTGVTDAGLKHVAQIKSLRWLRLRTGRIWGPGLAELAALPRLERLCIWGSEQQLSDRHIQYLEGLTNLKSLTLWGGCANLTDASLASIGRLRNLEELHFIGWDRGPRCTPAGLAHLTGLKKFKTIDFGLMWGGTVRPSGPDGDEVARQLARMPQIESIIGLAYLSAEGMKAVATLRNLKRLHVAIAPRPVGYQGDTGLSHLAGLPSLEELRLDGSMGLCDADLVCLESMTHLKDLSFSGEGVTDATMTSVEKLHQLERLDMHGVGVTKRGLNQLKALTNLQTLRVVVLTEGEATIDEIPLNISPLRNLKTLTMQGVALRDADLASLAGMSDLEWLALGAPLTESGLGRLKGLDSLKYMRIDHISCLSGESLAHLADFPRLGDLHLHGRITDAALNKVAGSPSLWSLTAGTDEPIRRETLERLKQVLPSVEYIHIEPLPRFGPPPQQAKPARPRSVPRPLK
jgi:Leucine-rich repeat (LRR) protein